MRSSILIAILAAGLLAIPPAAATEPGDVARTAASREELRRTVDLPEQVGLTAEQREEFRAAAQAAGVADDLIERALTDPALLAGIPVHVEVEESPVVVLDAMPGQPGTTRIKGFTDRVTATYRNFWGWRMFSLTMWKYWETNGHRITYAPKPRVAANVTGTGAFHGWTYRGLVAESDHYVYYGGRSKGAHLSYRQGRFEQCFLNRGCVWKKHPRLTLVGTYDGRSGSSTK